MSTLKITIARPIIRVKPNRKFDLHATNLQTAQPATIKLQVKDEHLLTHRARFVTLLSLYADATPPARTIFGFFIASKLWLALFACFKNVSSTLSFLRSRTRYPFLCTTLSCFLCCAGLVIIPRMTLMASLSMCFASLHAHQALALMHQLGDILGGFLSDLEARLAEKYLAFFPFIEGSIDAVLTSLERQIGPSPTTPLKIHLDQRAKKDPSEKPEEIVQSTAIPSIQIKLPEKCKATAKLEFGRENRHHEFDMEGWLLVANPGINHLAHRL